MFLESTSFLCSSTAYQLTRVRWEAAGSRSSPTRAAVAELAGENKAKRGEKVVLALGSEEVQRSKVTTFRSDRICSSTRRDAAAGARDAG